MTRDNRSESVIHCIELVRRNPFLQKFPQIICGIYDHLASKAFLYPLISSDNVYLFSSFTTHLNEEGIKILQNTVLNPEDLYYIATNFIEQGRCCVEKTPLCSETNRQEAFALSLCLLIITTEFMESFLKEQEEYNGMLDFFVERVLYTFSQLDPSHLLIDLDVFESLSSSLQKGFPDEGEPQKIKRMERHKTFIKLIDMLS